MPYHCVVLVKQVPDTKAVGAHAMNEDGTVNRGALPAIFNPEDLNALELALGVRDQYGGTVTVVTMGLPKACDVLRESLYRGADRAILLTDRRAAASDTLATSYILSCAVRKFGKVDLVVCGRQAIDGDTAQVGPQAAEKLGLPQVTYVEDLESIENGVATVRHSIGDGWQRVRAKLPCLLTVMETANEPRPAGARRLMKYKKARAPIELGDAAEADQVKRLEERGLLIEQWNLDDVGADLEWCGRFGSPTKVHRIQSVVLKAAGHERVEPTDEAISAMVHQLIEDHTIG